MKPLEINNASNHILLSSTLCQPLWGADATRILRKSGIVHTPIGYVIRNPCREIKPRGQDYGWELCLQGQIQFTRNTFSNEHYHHPGSSSVALHACSCKLSVEFKGLDLRQFASNFYRMQGMITA